MKILREGQIHESDYGSGPNNFHVERHSADTIAVELTYPNIAKPNQCRYVFVNQESVRASDGVRLHYDFERDGFVIEQQIYDPECPCFPERPDEWREVAFVKSWALMTDDCDVHGETRR